MITLPPNRRVCHGKGPRDAKVVIVGEQPGREEILQGEPFIGPAGSVLTDCCLAAKLHRGSCYITNVVKDLDHPIKHYIDLYDKNGPIVSDEGKLYIEYLKQEIESIQPNLVICVGANSLYALTGNIGIHKWRGSILESTLIPGLKVISVLHTATVIPPKNQYTNKYLIVYDLIKAVSEAEFPEIRQQPMSLYIRPSSSDAIAWLHAIRKAGCDGCTIDIDIETSRSTLEMTCIALGVDGTNAMSIPFTCESGDFYDAETEARIMLLIAEIIEDETITKRGQNFDFDLNFLSGRFGIKPRGKIDDTMIAQKIYLPDFPADLGFIASIHTDIPYYKDDGKKFGDVGDWDSFYRYNALDVITPGRAHPKQIAALEKQGNLETYYRQSALLKPLLYMMRRGIRVDVEGMKAKAVETEAEIESAQLKLNEIAGIELNPNSPKQIIEHFRNKYKLEPYKKRTPNGYTDTTDEDAMKRFSRKGILEAQVILDIRGLVKRLSTYLDPFKVDIDGRYRSSYNPVGTVTGRISSSESIFDTGGNQQNWPHDLLRYLVADEGYIMTPIDLSQIENRIVAYVGRVLRMIEAFETGKDVHRLTAGLIFGKNPDDISDEPGSSLLAGGKYSERFWGKKGNHSLNYDEAYKKFALQNEMPETEAKFLVEEYHRAYPEVRSIYHELVKSQLSTDRTVTNLFGRKRKFLERWGGELFRDAYAQIPQSTTADKINEHGVNHVYYNQSEFKEVELLTQIHDSIVPQIPLNIGLRKIAWLVMQMKNKLETPLKTGDREFKIPADVVFGLNMCKEDGVEFKSKNVSESVDEFAIAIKNKLGPILEEARVPVPNM